MMKCKYCGGNLTLEQAYCPHCGRPNEEAAQHVKDMEHYKSNFEDTKSDVYEVAEKNTEIMSHMIIITVLVILCVVVFVVSARSWSIHRGLLQFDAGIRQGSYMKQMEQYLEDEDYIGLSAFCDRHYIRPYSSNNSYEKYQLLMEASGAYRYFYESLMKAVTINSGNASILPGLYEDISDYYEQLERILHPVDHEKIDDCMDRILDYAEDSIPVLSEDKRILGVITSEDLIEMVDNEMGEDYAKLAGLTAEEDLKEPILQSMKKRLPWLIILLFLGMAVSSVVGLFENVVAVLPIVICFQSLVLDMAGNVGTQSLAVTIRVLMDENLTGKQKFQLVVKEVKTGSLNGILLGVMALLCLGVYVHFFKGYTWMGAFGISGCVGVSLLVAMAISSAVGTVIPMFFHKIKVDPAVASGPLITTVNDLVAVVTYYGMAWLLLIR